MARSSDHSFVVQPHCLFNTEFPIGLQMEEEEELGRFASQPSPLASGAPAYAGSPTIAGDK